MKVIFFTKYTRKGASSRLRTFQYLEFLTSQGVACTVSPFFNDKYLDEVYRSKNHNKWQAAGSFCRRIFALTRAYRYDKVVIEKELFPFFPSFFERILKWTGVSYIVDYDDAIFHNYDIHPNPLVRGLLGNKIANVMKYSSLVVAGNAYIRQKAIEFGAHKVELIPTVIDISKYVPRGYPSQGDFTIGWIGSPITFKYLPALKPVLEALGKRHKIKVKLVGVTKGLGLEVPPEELQPWKETEEVGQIRSFDVGIMPLEDNIWERGKCGYKLIQYMGCAIPVIGTPIGVNDILIAHGVNGFKAKTQEDWLTSFEYLIQHPEERIKMGLAGRRFVELNYSLQTYARSWLELLKA